jgi:hypothetical protein
MAVVTMRLGVPGLLPILKIACMHTRMYVGLTNA